MDRARAEVRVAETRWAPWENILLFKSINLRRWVPPKISAGGVTSAWCSEDFHGDQEAADVDWGKGEGEWERKRSDGGKPKRINRRIKEILILSERVLIFSSGLAMCAQPVISLETKKSGMWRELAAVCVCVCCLTAVFACVLFCVRVYVAWVASRVCEACGFRELSMCTGYWTWCLGPRGLEALAGWRCWD